MVDDLVQTGSTLLECAKVLLAAGAAAVSAYVTHAVFPNESWRKFVPDSITTDAISALHGETTSGSASSAEAIASPIRLSHFWITNSHPLTAARLRGLAPFQVLSIAPMLEDLLGI
jgi:hypothetical protein